MLSGSLVLELQSTLHWQRLLLLLIWLVRKEWTMIINMMSGLKMEMGQIMQLQLSRSRTHAHI